MRSLYAQSVHDTYKMTFDADYRSRLLLTVNIFFMYMAKVINTELVANSR